jgi:hypothetical protein
MAFVRKKNKTFKWPVEVREPCSDRPGEFETSEFVAIFKRMKMSELEKMGDATGLPFLEKIMVGWEGIEEDGQELPFSKSMLKEFADDVDWLKSVLNAYTNTYSEGEAGN